MLRSGMEEIMETRRKMKLGVSDRIILTVGYTLLGLFVLIILVPLVYVVMASFMDPNVLNNQGLSFHIKDWTLDAYRRVLENEMIWRGFANSLFYFYHLMASNPPSSISFSSYNISAQLPSANTLPSFMTTTCSQTSFANAKSWVAISMV